ncbi:RND family efflux transporter MFP subunit [Paucibacter oligotrophus]|uniref:RND family efflux transporter MFP subunit n=1 Tax=Roseateles oligotrophus TaxID=1769250 RepID=A0A840LCW4_9BURK|nr:efflux RND transporter periplasmic adaptor subunit [Roseateles oligotrophus]MBB4844523.1 RND family efflux transporter MFP subunit [Roseateles oligotrophus]
MTLTVYQRGIALFAASLLVGPAAADPAPKAKPALTVQVISPQSAEWAQTLAAKGSVAAWAEAQVGAELAGLRLAELRAQVGDAVKRGQLLARLNSESVQAELAQSQAALAEARAQLAGAASDATAARALQASGSTALSAQQLQQLLTQEATAQARLAAAKARVDNDQLRLSQTRILAPDDGVITARAAQLGMVVQPGQELFRLQRQNRLEWRAELPAESLGQLRPGQPVLVQGAQGQSIAARLRVVAPSVDPQTRLGLVYVDLPPSAAAAGLRAGSFARGEFKLGASAALSLPQSAVLQRDGFSYVFRVGADQRVQQLKVSTGRRLGERIELAAGLGADARVVASGVGFLRDGDSVKVVAAAAAPATAPAKP